MAVIRVPMSRIVAAANAAGSHWFEPGSMRFFRTRLPRSALTDSNGRSWFVTSEAQPGGPRRYSVRCFTPSSGSIATHGEFRSHTSRAAAIRAMRAAVFSQNP